LAREVTSPHERLLSVAAVRREEREALHYNGEVTFTAIVGVDGRLWETQVAGAFEAYQERIRLVLGLWRYRPARRGEEPVASRVEERTSLRVF
jgi:hypothetical protein